MSEEEENEIRECERLHAEINKQFPNSPFHIDCIKKLEELDEPMTQQTGIIIKDDRANEHNYYYDNLSAKERNEYINYMGVSKIDEDTPITLRQILKAMIDNEHYNNEIVKQDFHDSLEHFDISDNGIVMTPFFGS